MTVLNRTITIETTPMEFPVGTIPGPWSVEITGTSTASQQIAGTSAEFALPVGDYTVTAQRQDVNGQPLGPMVSATFSVTEELAVTIDVANGIKVTFG